jgi:hypothetical protein
MKTAVGPFVIVNMKEYNIICSNKATSRGRAMRCRVEKRASKRFRVGAAAMTPWSPTASPLHVRTETTVCLIGTVLITHSRPFQFHPLTSFGACICTWLQRKVATVGPEHRLSVPAGFVSLRFVSYQGTKGAKAWAELSPEARRPFFCLLAPIRNSTQAIPPNSYSLAVAQSVYSCRQVLFSVETWPLVGRILSVSLHMHGTGIST